MDPNNIQPPNHLITFKTWVDNTTPVTTAHHVEIQVTSFSSARFLATSSLISTTKDCTDLCCSKSCKHWEAEEISNGFIPMQCFYEVHPNIAKVFIEQLVLKTYYSSPTFISGKFTILWTYFSHRVIKLHKKAAFYILNSVNPDGALIYQLYVYISNLPNSRGHARCYSHQISSPSMTSDCETNKAATVSPRVYS